MELVITAKVGDLGIYSITKNGVEVCRKDGYVPDVFGIGGGDYFWFTIDLETGKLVRWQKPNDTDIKEWMNED